MSQYKSVILCANPRSGSTMLCDLMTATGVLGRPQSFYRPESIPEWSKRLGVIQEVKPEGFERAYLAAIQNHGTDASGTFGLRLMWDSVEGLVDRLSALFADQPSDAALFERAFGLPLYVNLVRQDKVAQAVSLVRAKQSGQWHLALDGSVRQGSKEPKPFTYDALAIAKEIAALTREDAEWQTWFTAQGLSPLQVTYEGLASNPGKVLADLLAAAGHDPAIAKSIEPATSKMGDVESRRWVAQYLKDNV